MGSGMSSVLPGLYIGSFNDVKNEEALAENKITHIVSVHDNAKPLREDMKYLCIKASDIPDQNLIHHFPTVNDFIHDARLNGGNVLVHCLAGMSRSVTVVIAYVMTVRTEYSWQECMRVVQGGRRQGNPNFGFRLQLRQFESKGLIEERIRFRNNFPVDEGLEKRDGEQCKKNLEQFFRWNVTNSTDTSNHTNASTLTTITPTTTNPNPSSTDGAS